MQALLARLATAVSRHRRAVVAVWIAVIVSGAWFALHQADRLQAGGWEVSGSDAKVANEILGDFDGYSVTGLAVVVTTEGGESRTTVVDGDRYRATICCAPATSFAAAFGTEPAAIAEKIARDARDPQGIARDLQAAQPPTANPFALGKALSNLCADIIQLQTPEEIRAVAAAVAPVWRPLVLSPETTPPLTATACREWGVPSSPQTQRAVVRSSIPSIVFANEWDHVIFPGEGREIANNLVNARLYSLRGLGHIAMLNLAARDVSCPRSIATAFVDDPSRFPSRACASTIPRLNLAP